MSASKTFVCSQCSHALAPRPRGNRAEGLATHSIPVFKPDGGVTAFIIYLCPDCAASMSTDAKDTLALAKYASGA